MFSFWLSVVFPDIDLFLNVFLKKHEFKKIFKWNGFYILLVMYVRIRSKNTISQLSYRRKKKIM